MKTFIAALICGATTFGFNSQRVTEGPLTLTIGDIATVTNFDVPQPVGVMLANSAEAPLDVTVEMKGLVDDCRAVGETKRQVSVPARGTSTAEFQFVCGRGTYSALYPVHVEARFGNVTAHAVQIFSTELPAAKKTAEFVVNTVPAAGAFALANLKTHRVAWSYIGGSLTYLPVGWSGSDVTSAANFSRSPVTRGGETRQTIQMHPPYRPRPGTVFAEYRLKLPATTPIRLSFFNAIRDAGPKEGKSDGVMFRVWASSLGILPKSGSTSESLGETPKPLFERHTDATTWQPGDADLSAFAGKDILLRLESHPGPKNNTTCDSSYWGDPVISVGPSPKVLTDAEKQELFTTARRALAGQKDGFVFDLGGGCRAVFVPGPNGIADGVIAFGDGNRNVAFEGLQITVNDQPVTGTPTIERGWTGRIRLCYRQPELNVLIWKGGPGLRIKVESPARINSLGAGPFDQKATRVYYGHGYCIVEPGAFRATAGGHNLSTSHVGCDFERGVSLLTASDTPPDAFAVNPAKRLYQLQTHPDATLTFVPSFVGAFDAALKYRPLSDKRAAPNVARKAGRFVFDIWGGRYADDTAKLSRCFDYGLTNSLVIMHAWQRWGYDYRLPDIFPPEPGLGTLADMQELGRACTARGALWGLHDNYIDFYPDATGFSYDHITFSADGQPRRAWLNEGREAQSYQFRPDRVMPFLKRNLDLIVPALHPSASFVDVFSSISTIDFYDRTGQFHSKRETQRCWGEAFALLGKRCGPTSSEAGGDHLIGWLDGADCQFMQLGNTPARWHNLAPSADWDRVPWFDAVNHTRFSQHGVGYSSRYEGGRSREEHGIESDDYITTELLTGHALMIDLPGMTRGAVRKHWLAQDFIESIAHDEIANVECAGSDIHRLIVTWNSGARVYVNRGETDWTIPHPRSNPHPDPLPHTTAASRGLGSPSRRERGPNAIPSPPSSGGEGQDEGAVHVLPQYGYFAKNGPIESSIERFGNAIAEQSLVRQERRRPGGFLSDSDRRDGGAPVRFYVNSRVFNPNAPLPITPRAERVESLGPRKFRLVVNWTTQQPVGKDLSVFYHFSRPTPHRRAMTEFYGGGTPKPATSQWHGDVLTGTNWTITIPDKMPLGDYEILAGLTDGKNRSARQRLQGDEDSQRRYRIGKLTVTADTVRLEKPEKTFAPSNRWLANTAAIDFGVAKTDGAFRCETRGENLIITPLPDGADFTVQLPLDRAQAVEAIDAKGVTTHPVQFTVENRQLQFTASSGDFACRVRLR